MNGSSEMEGRGEVFLFFSSWLSLCTRCLDVENVDPTSALWFRAQSKLSLHIPEFQFKRERETNAEREKASKRKSQEETLEVESESSRMSWLLVLPPWIT